MEQNEQQYIRGFNRGYNITKYLPDLSKSILHNIGSTNTFIDGFTAGKEEYEQELSRLHLGDIKQIRNRNQERDEDLERNN